MTITEQTIKQAVRHDEEMKKKSKSKKIIKIIKKDGSLVLKTTGDNMKVLELCTCCKTDVVTYCGNTVEIRVSI
ncbi:hypothetical protein F4V43_02400 [Paenibacillus spiritus]|uniref:Uncharacterized protein n=1 Tax=Paenibacillus spiritus TaxID=2496557 RepID=A0A5J5GGY9_9BACL|nr:hypothetical protein [Paenibacillus spiritus]KAA9007357.1 hypothetical protein F4V43_02400 [Paenibacillus spiritus]